MPTHYLYECDKCGKQELRYRNVSRCSCGGNLIRVETVHPWSIVIHAHAEEAWRRMNNQSEVAHLEKRQWEICKIAEVIAIAVAEERERCANITFDIGYMHCDDGHSEHSGIIEATENIAAAIRAEM